VEASRKAARVLLLAAGFAALFGGLAGVVAWGSIAAAYELAYGDGGATRGHTAVLVGVGLAVAAAGCCLYAADRLRFGRRGPAWITCALLVAGLAPAVFGGGTILAPRIAGAGAGSMEIGADVAALAPRWYVPVTAGLAVFAMCAAILVAMLVAVPQRES
jgi:hypothetical protein